MKFSHTLKAAGTASVLALLMSTAAHAVTLNMMNGSEPGSIDPHKANGDWENRIIGDYLEGLMTEDANANAIEGQAASYTVSDDGLVYTFTLRDGIQWSDGEPVTAEDFVFGFQRLFNPATASEYAYLQFPIVNGSEIADGSVTDFNELGVKALDDKTVEITLEGPTPFFLQALTHYTAFPVPKHVIDEVGDQWTNVENIVGNGPYAISEWVPGSYIKSVKSDTYWDNANVQIDEVNYFVQEDLAAALARYRAGEYDILTDIPSDQAQWISENLPGQDYFAPFLGIYYYVVNQEVAPFDNPEVRKALSMAINRDVIGPDVLGTGEVPMYGWVPEGTANYEGVELYQPEWAGLSYEERVAQAAEIMNGLGYNAQNPLPIQLRYNTNDNHQRIAVAISAMWEQIGVRTELFNAETAVHYDALRAGDFQVGRAGWLLDYSDPSNTLDLLRTGIQQGAEVNWGNNYGRYSNEEFDALLDQASQEQDLAARAALLGQAEKLAMDEYAAIPIYNYIAQNVVAPSVTGFVNNASDIHRTRWLSKSE